MFFLRYISASIIYFTRILKNVRNSMPFLLKFKQKFNSPFPLRYSFSSCKASGAHAALQLQKYREKQASFLHHAGADTAIGKIKVCSGHQFFTRLSRLFLFCYSLHLRASSIGTLRIFLLSARLMMAYITIPMRNISGNSDGFT